MKTIARKLRIKGRVQGVFFRDSMGAEAARLGVAGWVRNRSDGSVEAWVQGEADQVSEMIRWSRVGPSRARVDDVLIEEVELNFDLTSFERLETL